MSEIVDDTPARSKFWIWFMVLILLGLLMVPVLSIGLALKKTGWTMVVPHHVVQKPPNLSSNAESGFAQSEAFVLLKDKIEKVAASVIKTPTLHSKMQQVQIQAPVKSMSQASERVHNVLRKRNHQFVEAISPDSIRIVVILPSDQWPELSGSLQIAAEQDGFLYRGPNQTSSSSTASDSMVAEIEILRKVTSQAKGSKK